MFPAPVAATDISIPTTECSMLAPLADTHEINFCAAVVPTTAPDRLVDLLFRPYRYLATTIGLVQPATIWLTFGQPNAPDANGIALRPGHNHVEVILAPRVAVGMG